MTAANDQSSLVTPAWLEAHRDDPKVCLIEVAGLGQDQMQTYKAGHVPGAIGWKWKGESYYHVISSIIRRIAT